MQWLTVQLGRPSHLDVHTTIFFRNFLVASCCGRCHSRTAQLLRTTLRCPFHLSHPLNSKLCKTISTDFQKEKRNTFSTQRCPVDAKAIVIECHIKISSRSFRCQRSLVIGSWDLVTYVTSLLDRNFSEIVIPSH